VNVSAGPLDVDYFRAEHRKLGRRKRLRNHDARTDHADTLERPELGDEHRRLRSPEIFDPGWYGRFEFVDLFLIFDNPLVMLIRHHGTLSFLSCCSGMDKICGYG
jgi:hypothetical protein